MNTRNMMNHAQVGQGMGGMTGRSNSMGSSGLGSPNRSSPSIICMPKQQQARQPLTINRYARNPRGIAPHKGILCFITVCDSE